MAKCILCFFFHSLFLFFFVSVGVNRRGFNCVNVDANDEASNGTGV